MTSPTTNGGQPKTSEGSYQAPVGPKGINDPKTPGLHGSNHGNNGTQKG